MIFSWNLGMLINKLVKYVILKSPYYSHLEKKLFKSIKLRGVNDKVILNQISNLGAKFA